MNVLYLGPPSPLVAWLESVGETVTQTEERADASGKGGYGQSGWFIWLGKLRIWVRYI